MIVAFPLAGVLALVGLPIYLQFAQTTETSGALWWKKTHRIPLGERLPYLYGAIGLWLLAVAVAVLGAFLIARSSGRTPSRLNRYAPILKGVEQMPIQRIADVTNLAPAVIYRDLQMMIDTGMLNDLYIDYQTSRIVSKEFVPDSSHKVVVKCASCGSNNDVIVGITKQCAYCGEPLVLDRA